MPLLFSYGTLQQEDVQLSTVGRRLDGHEGELLGFERTVVEDHANVEFNGTKESRVSGMVFEVTDAELARIDKYEGAFSYGRVVAMLASGREAWVYARVKRVDMGPDVTTSDSNPPSSLRVPLTILVALVAPPLALFVWIALSGSQRRAYWRSKWVRTGCYIALGSALPLLVVGGAAMVGLGSDPNPNPVGLGLLFLAGALLGTLLMAVGVVIVGRSNTM